MSLLRLLNTVRPRPTMASKHFSTYTITPSQLSTALSQQSLSKPPRVVPLCASWFLPNDPQRRTGYAEFLHARVPSARFFDLDGIKDDASPYPHMLPPPQTFAAAMKKLGVNREDTVVLYDSYQLGIFSAPRAAWTMRVYGHPKVHLLDNFKAWVEEGLPVEKGPEGEIVESEYPVVEADLEMVAGFEEMKELAEAGGRKGVQVIDARPEGRFRGVDPEPRPGLSSGHVPGAISVPFSELVDPATKKMKTPEELRKVLLGRGVDPSEGVEKKLMCGTGVTAVVIETALDLAGIGGKRKVYDGSWTEWAQRVTEDSGLIVKEK